MNRKQHLNQIHRYNESMNIRYKRSLNESFGRNNFLKIHLHKDYYRSKDTVKKNDFGRGRWNKTMHMGFITNHGMMVFYEIAHRAFKQIN